MKELRAAPNTESSVSYYWERFGKDYLIRSHQSYLNDDDRGCVEIKFEELGENYDLTIRKLLNVFNVKSTAIEPLVELLKRHDRSNPSEEMNKILEKDIHVSSKKFSGEFKTRVAEFIMEELDDGKAGKLIESMRVEMEKFKQAE